MAKSIHIPSRLKMGASALIAIAASTPAVHAQGKPADGAGSDEESGEIVVTAQRRAESIQSVPIAIQAIGGEALQDRGVRGPQDIAQFVPNVNIASPSGPGGQPNITIRGVGLNDFNTNNAGPNGVYVDEFYISAPTAQGGSLFDLERVEVLKGPQGTLYGRNTSGGAINFITVKPSQEFSATVHGEYSSFDTVNLEAAVGGRLSETLAARVSGVFNYSDGYLKNIALGNRVNGTKNYALRGQLLWTPSDDLKILLKTQMSRSVYEPTNYRLVGTLNPNPFDPVAVLLGAPDKCSAAASLAGNCVDLFGSQTLPDFFSGNYADRGKARTRDFLSTLRIDYAAGSVDVTSLSGYNFNKRRFLEDTDASLPRILEIDYGTRSKEFTQELRASQTADKYNWVAGLYYLHERLDQEQPIYIYRDLDLLFGAPGSADGIAQIFNTSNSQKTESFAAFGQAEYEVAPKLRLIAGLRYTHDRKTFAGNSSTRFQVGGIDSFGPAVNATTFADSITQSRVNWRLAANYRFTPDVMLYASIATGFKSGGFNGGFIVGDQATRDAALAPVKPESVTSYEVGLKSSFLNRKVTFNIAGFYTDYKNQQLLVQVNRNGVIVFTLDNAQKARTMGIDADVTVRPFKGMTLSGQLGLLNTKLTKFVAARDPSTPDYSGNRLTFAPATTLAFQADYERPVGDSATVKLHYDNSYRAKHYFDPSNTPYVMSNAYWLHNARFAVGFGDGKYEIGAFARNFTNTKYVLIASDLTLTTGSVQQTIGSPRSYGVDLNIRF